LIGPLVFNSLSLLEEATSELIPAAKEDLTKNLEICDMIKSKQVPAKDALRTIKARFLHHNPNVHILVLQVISFFMWI
jgi:hepatocyte growth factor-regulated tyrosine kinase substrate